MLLWIFEQLFAKRFFLNFLSRIFPIIFCELVHFLSSKFFSGCSLNSSQAVMNFSFSNYKILFSSTWRLSAVYILNEHRENYVSFSKLMTQFNIESDEQKSQTSTFSFKDIIHWLRLTLCVFYIIFGGCAFFINLF